MKADLHNHLLIGFQPEWLSIQSYPEENLAPVLVDSALRKDIGLVAIISENFYIPKGSVHDRFTRICEDAEKLGGNYSFSKLGKNVLVGRYLGEQVIILNGQTVIINENGKRYDHLVVGSNQVPNGKDFDYTMKYIQDNNLMNFLEHPAVEGHCGVGLSKAEELLDKYWEVITGVEGHNGSMILPEAFSRLPLIGQFNRGVNRKAKELARKVGKPYIGTSDAHSLEQTGAGNIEFEEEFESYNKLKNRIEKNDFKVNEGYVSPISWMKNFLAFAYGTRVKGIV